MTVINNQMRRTGQRFSFTCVYRESSVGVRRHHRNKKLSPASSLNQHKLHREGLSLRLLMDNP